MRVRVSIGSLAVLGLENLEMLEAPSTLYLLQYSKSGCSGRCTFCPQSKLSSSDKSLVSRVPWPEIDLDVLVGALKAKRGAFERLCVQSVLKPGFELELLEIVRALRSADPATPLSVATTPVARHLLEELRDAGVERLGMGLDAASPRVFEETRKPYTWDAYLSFAREAVRVFGRGRVHVHLIFGLGESEADFLETMQTIYDLGAEVALFAFTPVRGTPLADRSPPPVERYRVMQVARVLLSRGYRASEFASIEGGKVRILGGPWLRELEEAFLTSGCPGCNRPFYNERPGLIYNYPSLRLLRRDAGIIAEQAARAGLNIQEILGGGGNR